MRIEALLYDPDDNIVPDATFTWEILHDANSVFAQNITTQTNADGTKEYWLYPRDIATYGWTNRAKCRGAIVKCTAEIATEEVFVGYLIIPMRNARAVEAIQGATMVRYNSAGIQPKYYTGGYGFVDINGNIDYNIIATMSVLDEDNDANYCPQVVTRGGKYVLRPQAMYYHGEDYDCCIKIVTNGDSHIQE